MAPGQYVDKDGKVWEVAPTLPADTENNDFSFGEVPDFSGEDSEKPVKV